MRRFWQRLWALASGASRERELAREIESHLGLMEEEYERRGMTKEEARWAARRAWGGVEQAKELQREERSFMWVERMARDARNGARGLARTPLFTGIAVLTLGLGIGANTALFSVVDAVLLRELAYGRPEQLVTVLHTGSAPVAPANFLDWREQTRGFAGMEAAEYWTPNLAVEEGSEHIFGMRVTAGLLPMLEVRPQIGRTLGAGTQREVVLSDKLWKRRFGGERGVLGRAIRLNGELYTVVGVMPEGFRFAPFWAKKTELWSKLELAERAGTRGGNSLRVFARLKEATTLEQARAEMAAVAARLERQYPGTNRGVEVTKLKEKVVGKVEAPLLMLMGACGLVLLIACANVAHMLLARTSGRAREIAVRTALGAGRARLAAQFMTESLVLAGMGAVAGLGLAVGGVRALVALAPATIPRVETIGVDGRVAVFLLVVSMATGLLFGLAPVVRSSGEGMSEELKEGGRGGSEGRRRGRMRRLLVVTEVALAFMLLAGAGLLLKSFAGLRAIDAGFRTERLLTMVVSVAGSGAAAEGKREAFYREMLERVRSVGGVRAASGTNHLPLAGDLWGWPFVIEGEPEPRPGEGPLAVYRMAMPGYFETMGMTIVRGRGIEERDHARAGGVAVINERAAERYFAGREAVGRRIAFGRESDGTRQYLTVVGVVRNVRQLDWAAQTDPEVWLAGLQNRAFLGGGESRIAYMTLVVRTEGDAAAKAEEVRAAIRSVERGVTISAVQTMEAVVEEATAQARFEMLLFGLFGVVALVLSSAGIYGVMSHAVSKRTREMGIRMSLGATRGGVMRMVAREAMREAGVGAAVGLGGALAAGRLMEGMLYEVRPADPAVLGGVAAVLLATALVAGLEPARRASRVEPMTALRSE